MTPRLVALILVVLLLGVGVAFLLWHKSSPPPPDEPAALEVIEKFESTTTFPTPPTTANVARAVVTASARSAPIVSRPPTETSFDSAHKPPAGRYAGFVNGSPCGDTLPPCRTLWNESKGSPTAVNRTGCGGRGCFGAWQYDPLTWNRYRGYERADLAPLEVQNEKARLDWNMGAGCHHWASC